VVKTGLFQDYPWWHHALIPLLILAFAQSALANAEPAMLSLYCNDNRLTVSLKDVPLRAVLEKIAQEAGISIVLKGSAENRVSAEFSGIGIEEGIKRLTKGSSHAFIYARNDPEALFSKPMTVFIYSESPGSCSIFGVPIAASSEPISDNLAPNSEDSARAFKTLKDRASAGNEDACSHIIELALYDKNMETRVASIEFLASIGQERVTDALIQALDDDEAGVRAASVRALGQYPGERALNALRVALQDPVPEVRKAAMLVIDQMDNGEREEYDPTPRSTSP
jgi:hypothetical protein